MTTAKLYHPKTVAVPEINSRMLKEDYFQVFPGIPFDGKDYTVVTSIKADDKFVFDNFNPRHELARLNHSWHYMIQRYPKGVIDALMLRILEYDGETKFKRNIMFKGALWIGGAI